MQPREASRTGRGGQKAHLERIAHTAYAPASLLALLYHSSWQRHVLASVNTSRHFRLPI